MKFFFPVTIANASFMCAYRRVKFSAYAEKKISDVPCALIFYSASVTYKYSSSALNPFKATLNHRPSMRSRSHSFLISHPYQMFLTAVIRLVFYILRCRCSHCPPAASLSLFLCFNFFVVERQYTADPHYHLYHSICISSERLYDDSADS